MKNRLPCPATIIACATCAALLDCGGGKDDDAADLPAVMANCEPMQGQYAVDAAMSRSFPLPAPPRIGAYSINGDQWIYSTVVGSGPAFFQVSGTGAVQGQMAQPVEGGQLSIERALIAPDVSATGLGTMYAVSPGSGSLLARKGDQLLLDLRKATTLSSCADHPVAGEINLCFEADIFTPCPDGATGGMVESTPWTSGPSMWAGGLGKMTAQLGGDAIEMRGQTSLSGMGPITWAYVRTNVVGPFQGKVLCAGAGSQVVELPAGAVTHEVWQLRNLGLLEGTGTSRITGCLR